MKSLIRIVRVGDFDFRQHRAGFARERPGNGDSREFGVIRRHDLGQRSPGQPLRGKADECREGGIDGLDALAVQQRGFPEGGEHGLERLALVR